MRGQLSAMALQRGRQYSLQPWEETTLQLNYFIVDFSFGPDLDSNAVALATKAVFINESMNSGSTVVVLQVYLPLD